LSLDLGRTLLSLDLERTHSYHWIDLLEL
jgi:hypothetical protein